MSYLLNKQNMIRTAAFTKHSASLENPASREAVEALNTVQATPWRINAEIYTVMNNIWLMGGGIAGVPSADADVAIPDRMPDAVWETMKPEERKIHIQRKARAHQANGRLSGKRSSFLRQLEVARMMLNEDTIWFPHSFDFRFRMYPIPQDLNPQGDELTKALLEFAEGKPVGAYGGKWLAIQAANTGGHDKLALEERIDWAYSERVNIKASANDPLNHLWWTEVEEPFMFLAACIELTGFWEQGEAWVSHLPIQVDGSCNGLQHLSAMGRDSVGAQATNVAANKTREDIYQRVADRCCEIVAADVAAGVEWAADWAGRINRKTVKRAVMTTPYGVTTRGIQDQLITDHHTIDVVEGAGKESGHTAAASYFTKVIQQSMGEVIGSASAIMGYIQDVAGAFAENHLPLQWTNAAGCRVNQEYINPDITRVDTVVGDLRITVSHGQEGVGINARRQRNGAAPNFVHSQDAAHMALTVNLAKAMGVTSFSMIHDSYGTHAADMRLLNAALRQTFRTMYSEDVLGRFHAEQVSIAEPLGIELPEPPELGDFDVTEVIHSPFFFA